MTSKRRCCRRCAGRWRAIRKPRIRIVNGAERVRDDQARARSGRPPPPDRRGERGLRRRRPHARSNSPRSAQPAWDGARRRHARRHPGTRGRGFRGEPPAADGPARARGGPHRAQCADRGPRGGGFPALLREGGAREFFRARERFPVPSGEQNELKLYGRGVFMCISPWNFPLSIFTGQVAGALAAGNSVLAKPARADAADRGRRGAAAARGGRVRAMSCISLPGRRCADRQGGAARSAARRRRVHRLHRDRPPSSTARWRRATDRCPR